MMWIVTIHMILKHVYTCFDIFMKMQGRKGKCKDNIKSYSLDCFEQVERSKILTFGVLFCCLAWQVFEFREIGRVSRLPVFGLNKLFCVEISYVNKFHLWTVIFNEIEEVLLQLCQSNTTLSAWNCFWKSFWNM